MNYLILIHIEMNFVIIKVFQLWLKIQYSALTHSLNWMSESLPHEWKNIFRSLNTTIIMNVI
jgi:hypothetical protein